MNGMVEKFRLGDADVWAIADIAGERDLSAFPDADPATIQALVPTGFAANAVMVFAVRLDGVLTLVDTGYGNLAPGRPSHLLTGLANAGLDPSEVDAVLLTHLHLDHIGGLVWDGRKTFPNAKVFVSREEREFWLNPENRAKHHGLDYWFELSNQYLPLYGDAVAVFQPGDEVVPGVTAVDLRGHTPGHAGFLLESRGERLLVWGDLAHAMALQFPRPDINSMYDMDPEQSREARQAALERAASEPLLLAGAHLPFPAVGRVTRREAGGYGFRSGLT